MTKKKKEKKSWVINENQRKRYQNSINGNVFFDMYKLWYSFEHLEVL